MKQNEIRSVHTVCEGEVRVWIEQDSSIHLAATSPYGDPVEMTAEEAHELARILDKLASTLDRMDE